MLAYVTGPVNEELRLRNEYLVTENRILRDQIPGRVRLTPPDRVSLAEIGERLSRKALEEVAQIVLFPSPTDRISESSREILKRGRLGGLLNFYNWEAV
jgi:hypothetical protein